MSAVRTRVLDALELLVIVDNETDTLSSVEAGLPQVPEVVQHAAATPPSREHEGHACRLVFDQLCWACHGYSVLLRARAGTDRGTALFDVGPSGTLWLDNARRLRVDLADIELIFLSHWHWDHSGGLPEVIAAIAQARRAAGRPPPRVDVHPDRPDQRGIRLPHGEMLLLPQEPDFAALEAAGGELVRAAQAHALLGGLLYGSGPIARLTAYETGLDGHYSFHGEQAQADPLIMDERFVAAQVRGRPFPARRSTWCSAATTWPAAAWKPASTTRCATWSAASHRACWRRATAPAGAPRPRWPVISPRRATLRAWWGPATAFRPDEHPPGKTRAR